jgi:hypothetical protein
LGCKKTPRPANEPFYVRINRERGIDELAGKNSLTKNDIQFLQPDYLSIPLTSPIETSLILKTFKMGKRFAEMGKPPVMIRQGNRNGFIGGLIYFCNTVFLPNYANCDFQGFSPDFPFALKAFLWRHGMMWEKTVKHRGTNKIIAGPIPCYPSGCWFP